MNYYNRHIGDYAKQTSHLTFAEDGAYNRMLDLYYASEQPLPKDREALYRKVRARSKGEKAMIDRLLTEFFDEWPDGWHKNRCDEEIAEYQIKAQKNRDNGQLGGRPPKPPGFLEITDMVSKNNPNETLASSQEPVTKKHHSPPSGAFREFWDAWPRNERKQAKGKCEAIWKRKGLDAKAREILAHVSALKTTDSWRGGFVPAPLVYLNQERWDGAEFAMARNTFDGGIN